MKKIIASVLIFILSANSIVFAATLSDVLKEKEKVAQELKEVKQEKSDAQKSITKIENQIAIAESEINNLDNQINDLESEVKKLEEDLVIAEEDCQKQQELLDKRVIALYKSGKTSYIEVLLASEDISDFLSRYYIVGKIAENDQKLLSDLENLKQSIENKKGELSTKLLAIEDAKKSKEVKLTNLNNNKVEKNNLINELTQEEKELQKKQNQLDSEYNKLKDEANKKASTSKNSKYTGGTMTWPVPSSSTITCYYGMRKHPITGVYKLHTGIDIGAPTGSNIVATADGTVIQRGSSTAWGNYIAVDHGGGVVTFYAHASSLVASMGQKVTKGQVIAKVGSTGYSTGPHLHFEIRINGSTINPLDSSKGYLKNN